MVNNHKTAAFSLNIPLASTINCASKHNSSDSNTKTTKYMKYSPNLCSFILIDTEEKNIF
jgi:hypothetical protein